MELLWILLAVVLLLFLNQLIFTHLLRPTAGTLPMFAVVPVTGDGEGLEQTLRHLNWLRREKFSRFTVLVVDAGLTPDGHSAVQALGRQDSTLLFCPAEEALRLMLKRKDDHGDFSL